MTTAGVAHRAAGVLLGQASGDALGVPYEFAARLPDNETPQMRGGGLGHYAPGEWSDDTQMAGCIAQVAASGADLTTEDSLDEVAERLRDWLSDGATDVGVQTRAVLSAARGGVGRPSHRLRSAAAALHKRTGRTAGNGALMRTSIVGISSLTDRDRTAAAARALAELTHTDPLAGDSCVLWSEAVRMAATQGVLEVTAGLDLLPADRRDQWAAWVADAAGQPPRVFSPNGFTVTALQAAWSAIHKAEVPEQNPAGHLRVALESAVRAGDDTDTVAAIAGGLLGAYWGVSAIPWQWQRAVHGWPGLRARDLVRLAILTATGGQGTRSGWPALPQLSYDGYAGRTTCVRHPHDPQVWLSGVDVLGQLPEGVDAVVSLCRLGVEEVPAGEVIPDNHLEFWLVDSPAPDANPHLSYVLGEAADAVAGLRAEGRTVLLHCVQAHSRTPTVATLYAVRHLGRPLDGALADVRAALPDAAPNQAFLQALQQLLDE